MPVHLFTIPHGSALPPVGDLPEGSPFLLDGDLHFLRDGDWVLYLPDPSAAAEGATLEIVGGVPTWVGA